MAVKAKRIKCARCGERGTVMRGERGPASIYCDLCRDEVKREQNALRAQAYRQRKASYGGCADRTPTRIKLILLGRAQGGVDRYWASFCGG